MNRLILPALFAIVAILFAPPAGSANDDPATEVRLATWRLMEVLDPAYTTRTEEMRLFDALFQGLVNVEGDKMSGGDAESWEVSEDGKTYRFKLREGLSWSDGHPLTAHDYLLAFQRMLDPALNQLPRPTYLLHNIKNAAMVEKKEIGVEQLGVRVLDERTLEIKLTSPASYFLDILTYPGLVPVPSHLIEKHGNDWWKSEPLVSNGAYVLTQKGAGRHLVLKKRNKTDYPEAPDIAHLIHVKNADAAMRRVINSELDIIYDIRKNEVDWVKNRVGYILTKIALPNTIYVAFNTKKQKFADKRVRQALSLAIDREAIAKASDSNAANSFAPIGMLSGAEGGLRSIPARENQKANLEKARKLLAEAGYTQDNPLKLSILKVSRPVLGNTALALRSMFARIGVKATMEEVEDNEQSRLMVAKDYEVSVANWLADYNDGMTFYGILESGASKNHSAFSNPTFDALLNKALEERDSQKRRKIYVEMENVLWEEAPIVPIVHYGITIVSAPAVTSIGLTPVDPKNSKGTQKYIISIYDIRLGEGRKVTD